MKYLKYTQYAYLIVAVFMIGNGFVELNSGTDKSYLSFFLAAVAVGMFFFRRIMGKKFDNQNNNQ